MENNRAGSMQSYSNFRDHPNWYQSLFDYASDAIFVYHRTPDGNPGHILDVNDAACRMLGYTKEELLKLTVFDTTAPERHDNYPVFRDRLNMDRHVFTETVKLTKDGERIPTELSSHLFEVNGNFIVVSIVRDITDRKKADDELRDSQQRYYTLLNSAYDAVSLHELNAKGRPGRYIEVNDAFCKRVGYSRRELLKLTPWDVVERKELAHIKKLRDDILLKKGIVFDVIELSKAGLKRPVEITAKLLELKDRKYVLSISRDITERKRIELDLKENEERYRMLFNSSNDAVLVHYMDAQGKYGNYIEVNDVACQMLGYSREQLLNMRPIDLAAAEKVDSLDPKHTRMFARDKNTVFKTVLASSDGRNIAVEVSSHGFDYKGRHLVIAVVRDITERKQIEHQLLEAQEKLARSEKLAALGQLASGIAHDMGTPLTVIANVADYLREALGDTDEIVSTQLDRLERQADRANSIASDLLDFAKVRESVLEEVTMDLVIIETLGQVDIPENIEVLVEYQEETCRVLVDFNQMVRVLTNMISNAVLSMPDGGTLTLNTQEVDCYVITEIKDTGVGISAYHLNKIFEPLFTTRSKEGSTGIGLAICKSIVDAHKGVIEVDSEEGKGTTFSIKLSCAR
ncbi:PAS domain S-box protein [Chloroflexota bacterium]